MGLLDDPTSYGLLGALGSLEPHLQYSRVPQSPWAALASAASGFGRGALAGQQAGSLNAYRTAQADELQRKALLQRQQQQYLQQATQGLSPQDQAAAFINPGAFAESRFRKPDQSALAKLMAERDMLPQGDPRRKMYDDAIGKATTHQPGTTVNVDREGNRYGDPPKDMSWARNPDGTVALQKDPQSGFMRPIAVPVVGGTVERETGKESKATAEKQKQQMVTADIVTEDIGRVLKTVDDSFFPVTGPGSMLSGVPGTSAHNVKSLLDSLKANVGFEKLQQMRAASPTGGALGQVTERENTLLQSVLGSLEQSQSKEQFVYNLKRLNNIWLDIVHGVGLGPTRLPLGEPKGGAGKADPLGIR